MERTRARIQRAHVCAFASRRCILRIVLVIGAGLGVMGVVVADVVVTAVLMVVMVRLVRALIRPVFSQTVLRESLVVRAAAGAARLRAAGDGGRRQVRPAAATCRSQDVGVYSMGVSFGLIQKIALGAFEYAWAPFYYATAREPDAPAGVQHRHDLRRRRARADDGRPVGNRRRICWTS